MQKLFKGAHIEPAKDPLDSWTYCTKAETRVSGPFVHGDPPRPRQDKLGDRAKHNALLKEIGAVAAFNRGLIRAEDYSRTSRGLDEIIAKDGPPAESRSNLDNYWLYGATGTGKSKYARETWPNPFLKDVTKWWDHYDGQPAVLVDDLDPEHKFLAKQLKNWSDHYPFTPEIKGGRLPPIRPATIIVTSQYHPEDIFTPEDTKAILRRFKLKHFVKAADGGTASAE